MTEDELDTFSRQDFIEEDLPIIVNDAKKFLSGYGDCTDMKVELVETFPESLGSVERRAELLHSREYLSYDLIEALDSKISGLYREDKKVIELIASDPVLENIFKLEDAMEFGVEDLVSTTSFYSVLIHEFVHSLQRSYLPLPILEISAYYYTREILANNSINMSIEKWRPFLEKWAEIEEKFGKENIKNLIFDKSSDMDYSLFDAISAQLDKEWFDKISQQQGIVWEFEEISD